MSEENPKTITIKNVIPKDDTSVPTCCCYMRGENNNPSEEMKEIIEFNTWLCNLPKEDFYEYFSPLGRSREEFRDYINKKHSDDSSF